MSLSELLPSVQSLPRAEKYQLLQLLAADLAHSEGLPHLQPGASYPVWSPYDANEAAATLLLMLEQERATK
jgi:hypothetical protein